MVLRFTKSTGFANKFLGFIIKWMAGVLKWAQKNLCVLMRVMEPSHPSWRNPAASPPPLLWKDGTGSIAQLLSDLQHNYGWMILWEVLFPFHTSLHRKFKTFRLFIISGLFESELFVVGPVHFGWPSGVAQNRFTKPGFWEHFVGFFFVGETPNRRKLNGKMATTKGQNRLGTFSHFLALFHTSSHFLRVFQNFSSRTFS